MSSNKKGKSILEEEEHGGGHSEGWLVSYADLMTLLFGFFVLMYSFASQEKSENWEKVKQEFAEQFGGEYVNPYEDIKKELEKMVEDTPFEGNLDVAITEEGLRITFRSTVLFASGKSEFSSRIVQPMTDLIDILAENISANNLKIIVEGHTDDNAIHTIRYPSNWELSAARATSLVRLFQSSGINGKRMRAIAFGDSRPIMPNRDDQNKRIEVNQSKNRRVVIRLVSTMKMDLGDSKKGSK